MIDLRTPKERERDERNRQIRNEYRRLKSENPKTSDYRMFVALGRKYNLSWVSVRKIVLAA